MAYGAVMAVCRSKFGIPALWGIVKIADGDRPCWDSSNGKIYYDKSVAGVYRLFRCDENGANVEDLSALITGLPAGGPHVGNPAVSPDGTFVIVQAEQAGHSGAWNHALCTPGAGLYNDLYYVDVATWAATQLTSVGLTTPAGGSLHPKISKAGTQVLWTDRQGAAGEFGNQQLKRGSINAGPPPSISGITTWDTLPVGTWQETNDWWNDDLSILISATSVATGSDYSMDICKVVLTDPTTLIRLTQTSGVGAEPGHWDEHAKISPDGAVVSYISSNPTEIADEADLAAELWLMDVDGANQRQVTHFNTPGKPSYRGPGGWLCKAMSWDPNPPAGSIRLAMSVRDKSLGITGTTVEIVTFVTPLGV